MFVLLYFHYSSCCRLRDKFPALYLLLLLLIWIQFCFRLLATNVKKNQTPGLIGSEYKILKNICHGCRNFTKVLQIAKVKDYIPYVGKTDQGVTFFYSRYIISSWIDTRYIVGAIKMGWNKFWRIIFLHISNIF